MYCPECGKELIRGDWRCATCGADLRRILREEYWSKAKAKEGSESSAERFRMPDSSLSSDLGWRAMHPGRRPAVVWTIVGATALVILIGLLYMAFQTPPSEKNATDEPVALSPVDKPPDQPDLSSPAPAATPEPAPPSTKPPDSAIESATPLTKEEVESFVKNWLDEWRKTFNTKEVKDFANFYSESFKSNTGKSKGRFVSAKSDVSRQTNYAEIQAGEPEIVIKGGQAKVSYDQTYFSDQFSDKGKKLLTIVREKSGLKITFEAFENHTPDPKISATKIKETILAWRKSWEDLAIYKKLGDLPGYYHDDFIGSGGRNKSQWLDTKLRVADSFAIITVDIKNMRISVLEDRAAVSFYQKFRSDKYADEGVKVLVFKLEGDKPLITREQFAMERKAEPLEVDNFWGP